MTSFRDDLRLIETALGFKAHWQGQADAKWRALAALARVEQRGQALEAVAEAARPALELLTAEGYGPINGMAPNCAEHDEPT